jgi:hypothetical protein
MGVEPDSPVSIPGRGIKVFFSLLPALRPIQPPIQGGCFSEGNAAGT